MALAVTASLVESCLDISWQSAVFSFPQSFPQRCWIAVSDGCDRQEWITEVAATGLPRVRLNVTEMRSNSYNVSVKGSTSLSYTEVQGVSGSKVVQSGSQSTVPVVPVHSYGLDTATAGSPSSSSASVNSGESWYCIPSTLHVSLSQ